LCGEQVSNTLQRTTASFLWTGKKQINGGNCLVAWEKVMRPINLGGLGIHNLEIMSWTLQMRWFWLEKIGAAQSWAGLRILVYHNASAMFAIAIESLVGNGRNTYFWTGRWLHGSYLEYLAPNVVSCVPLRFRKRRSIFEALQGIQCNLGWRGLAEYLKLWDMLGAVNLDNSISGVTSLVLTCIQNVEFQKLVLKWSARKSNKVVFLFLFPTIPRFSFGFDDAFRVYNLLVWKFGSSIENFIWVLFG
jgi:hypothetical protein